MLYFADVPGGYPAAKEGELALPERIIMLDGSGRISFDVLAWLCMRASS